MANYSVLLKDGFRADCSGERIGNAMRALAEKRPDLIPTMTPNFITYIRGVSSYGFRQTEESRKAMESIRKNQAKV